jgi:alpha-glucosidase
MYPRCVLSALLVGNALASVAGAEQVPATNEPVVLESPDGTIRIVFTLQPAIRYHLYHRDHLLFGPATAAIQLRDRWLGRDAQPRALQRARADRVLTPVVPHKRARIIDRFNELAVEFAGGYRLRARAYDDGFAYRFETALDGTVQVIQEDVSLALPAQAQLWWPGENSLLSHNEPFYRQMVAGQLAAGEMASLPLLWGVAGQPKVLVMEADLRDYPGMYLAGGTTAGTLHALHAAYPRRERAADDRTVAVLETEPFIARTAGTRTYPWRAFVVAARDANLLESDLMYKLAPEQRLQETDWIRPGKAVWDWWHANTLFDVPFTPGINTETYMYHIDFAARHGARYVILDEGWSDTTDLLRTSPAIDMEALSRHARQRGVGLVLWVLWNTLDRQMQVALDRFAAWGVAGIKVDFIQRRDQPVVNYYWRVAEEAARRRMLVAFHGCYSPDGLRAYPNVITREGVAGSEHNKWSRLVTPEHDLTWPFVRMVAGPADYTPGAMRNATEQSFQVDFVAPMSQGTRTHQLAMYVVYESPLQMLADSPSRYLREPASLAFLEQVPTVWDETRVLDARIGDYVLVARRAGPAWFVAAMTDGSGRSLRLDLGPLLGPGRYRGTVHRDGPRASTEATDHVVEQGNFTRNDVIELTMAPGGGWVLHLQPAGD